MSILDEFSEMWKEKQDERLKLKEFEQKITARVESREQKKWDKEKQSLLKTINDINKELEDCRKSILKYEEMAKEYKNIKKDNRKLKFISWSIVGVMFVIMLGLISFTIRVMLNAHQMLP